MSSWPGSTILAATVALVPACIGLWRGWYLARLVNDPALSERIIAGARVRGEVFGCVFVLLVIVWPGYTIWTLPLLVISRMAASYPLRRILYGETWSLGAYLSFFLRLSVGVSGIWVLLGAGPALIGLAGARGWVVAALLGAVLVLWGAKFSTVLRWLVAATPVDDPILLARFARLAESCGLAATRFDRVDVPGGVFANAVALPARRQPAVLFSGTLLERLDRDEVTAICAHELAHLEYYTPRRLRWVGLATLMLIAVGVLLSPIARIWLGAGEVLTLSWPILLFGTLLLRAQRRQRHETASDLRAVALTGDADALIRGLTTLHTLARLPRRFDAELERRATHPSLAHRIQAIREASGASPVPLDASVTLASTDADASVTFHEDRLEWKEGSTATHTYSYSRISELRLDVRGGVTRLVVVAGRHRWQLPLAAADVARAQAAMDLVDSRMATPAAAPSHLPIWSRALAVAAVVLAASVGQFALIATALLALFQPASPLTGAAGVTAVAAAVLMWRGPTPEWMLWSAGLPMVLCGMALIVVAIVARRNDTPAATRPLLGVLAVCVALASCWLLLGGVNVVRLHQGAREWPAATLFPLALAASLALSGMRGRWPAAAAFAIAGVAVWVIGSIGFLDALGGDPLLAPAPPVVLRTMSGSPFAELSTELDISDLRISPTGRSVALATENQHEETTFHVGRTGGPLVPLDADDLVFVDDDRLLLLGRDHDATILREAAIDHGTQIVRQHRLTGVDSARLSFDGLAQQWVVVGITQRQVVRIAGRIGSDAVDEQRWTLPARRHFGAYPLVSSDPDVLMLERRDERGPLERLLERWWWRLNLARRTTSVLWVLGSGGERELLETRLDLACQHTVVDGPLVCTAFDGTRTRVFAVDYRQRRVDPLAMMPGQFAAYGGNTRGWMPGWWESTPMALRLDTAEGIRLPTLPRTAYVSRLAASHNIVAVASTDDRRSIVRLYAIE